MSEDRKSQDKRGLVLEPSAEETRRLEMMGAYLTELTRPLLARAGIVPGMRVLDFGAGAGDVAMLAAELVGPSGEVVGIDRAPESLESARRRAAARGLGNVRFMEGDEATAGKAAGERPFDAVIGRLVLGLQRDPTAVLRALLGHVRPGGIVAFQEIDQEAGSWSQPRLPLYERTFSWIADTFRHAGAKMDSVRLSRTFDEAGVVSKRVLREGNIEDGGNPLGFLFLTQVLRAVLPLAERVGVATAAEVQIDTLGERLAAEVKANRGLWVPAYFASAWGRVPS